MTRSSGVLLPVYSLPSPYGVGTFGRSAYDFIDFLKAAGQRYWQVLPLGFTDFAGSPYSSVSTFAGNPDYIDLDILARDGLLEPPLLAGLDRAGDAAVLDRAAVHAGREALLRRAFENGRERYAAQLEQFCARTGWLRGFALYLALKTRFDGKPWYDWPEELKARRSDAVAAQELENREEIAYQEFLQFLFYRQWRALRDYARENGVQIIGDVPIYVDADSADVWTEPWFFELDARCRPIDVAGVPPDYFCAEGQLWGNPLYDWERIRADGWGWWIRRIDGARALYDVIRIDHFRAFASYWAVPFGQATAINGRWRAGPGEALVSALQGWFPGVEFIAEDLGILTPDVGRLIHKTGLPGMKVLEFAFAPDGLSDYLPHKYEPNCVCYAGTHDNNTILGWLEDIGPGERDFAKKYLAVNGGEGWCWGLLRGGMASPAKLYIAQTQDLLEKPGSCRTNSPGTLKGNWRWRLLPGECSPALAEKLLEYTKMYGRAK